MGGDPGGLFSGSGSWKFGFRKRSCISGRFGVSRGGIAGRKDGDSPGLFGAALRDTGEPGRLLPLGLTDGLPWASIVPAITALTSY